MNREKILALDPAIQVAIDSLVPEVKPVVENIEKSIKTTQNHYGRYMSALSQFAGNESDQQRTIMLFVISESMLKAGANQAGIDSAMSILTGSA